MSSPGTITTCDYLNCPDAPDPSINTTVQIQGIIPADKLTSCIYKIDCKSSEPNCTHKEKKFIKTM